MSALAAAVASARKPQAGPAASAAGARPASLDGSASSPKEGAARPLRHRRMWQAGGIAAALALALGTGFAAGRLMPAEQGADARLMGEVAASLKARQADVAALAKDVAGLRAGLDGVRKGLDQVRADAAQGDARTLDRIDRAAKASQENLAKLASLPAQVDRLEGIAKEAREAAKDPAGRIAGLGDRLDRIEKQMAAAAAQKASASQAAPEPAQTGSVSRDTPLDGWILREVYDGIAVVEGKNRRIYEVATGDSIPGVGKVEAIERRGKRWVVVTARGTIEPQVGVGR